MTPLKRPFSSSRNFIKFASFDLAPNNIALPAFAYFIQGGRIASQTIISVNIRLSPPRLPCAKRCPPAYDFERERRFVQRAVHQERKNIRKIKLTHHRTDDNLQKFVSPVLLTRPFVDLLAKLEQFPEDCTPFSGHSCDFESIDDLDNQEFLKLALYLPDPYAMLSDYRRGA
jgi:hypothetical protein